MTSIELTRTLPAAHLLHRPGVTTRRADPATARSLNEPGQPTRVAGASIDAIVDHLAVERAEHRRYRPRGTITFCNVYAHDLCHLAGAYLPRVWWTPSALDRLARREPVAAALGATVSEQRANDLSRWLVRFGSRFGWARTLTLDALQAQANRSGVGLIVARRREEGRPGHVAVVVAEQPGARARRDGAGAVLLPVQSQAGVRNVRRGAGTTAWWLHAKFAEHGFWHHA